MAGVAWGLEGWGRASSTSGFFVASPHPPAAASRLSNTFVPWHLQVENVNSSRAFTSRVQLESFRPVGVEGRFVENQRYTNSVRFRSVAEKKSLARYNDFQLLVCTFLSCLSAFTQNWRSGIQSTQ